MGDTRMRGTKLRMVLAIVVSVVALALACAGCGWTSSGDTSGQDHSSDPCGVITPFAVEFRPPC
jgi:hypothetical protein